MPCVVILFIEIRWNFRMKEERYFCRLLYFLKYLHVGQLDNPHCIHHFYIKAFIGRNLKTKYCEESFINIWDPIRPYLERTKESAISSMISRLLNYEFPFFGLETLCTLLTDCATVLWLYPPLNRRPWNSLEFEIG